MKKLILRTLYLITIIGWLIVFSTFLFPTHTFGRMFWEVVGLPLIGLSCISVSVYAIRKESKESWSKKV